MSLFNYKLFRSFSFFNTLINIFARLDIFLYMVNKKCKKICFIKIGDSAEITFLYNVFYYIILYILLSYYIIFNSIVLCIILYLLCIILYYIILYYIILYYIFQYNVFDCFWLYAMTTPWITQS